MKPAYSNADFSKHIKNFLNFPLPVLILQNDFTVFWSNKSAEDSSFQSLAQNLTADTNKAKVLCDIEKNGTCMVQDITGFEAFSFSFIPITAEKEDYTGFLVFAVRQEKPKYESKAPMISKIIREAVDSIFLSMDAAFLKASVLKGEMLLSPHFSKISRDSYNMLRMARNLSEYSKLYSDSYALDFSIFDITAWFSDFLAITQHMAKSKGVDFSFIIPKDPLYISLDAEKYELAVLNLIHNSILYSRGEQPRISVSVSAVNNGVLFEVEDNGPGISAENSRDIFSPYYAMNSPQCGLGLGLPLAKGIAQRHGGSVEIIPGGENGTTARLFIPSNLFYKKVTISQRDRAISFENRFSDIYINIISSFA